MAGGHDARPVRVGNTVRRPMKRWAGTIHALLTHLENVGFSGAPRVLGIDDSGREILTYIPGQDGRTAHCYDDQLLPAIGHRLRTERSTFARRCEDTLTTSWNSWESAILK